VTPGWYFSLSPNPASSIVTVTMLKGNQSDANQPVTGNALTESTAQTVATTAPEAQTNIPVTYTVKIVNSFGSLFYSSKKTGNTFTIPVGNLRKGNYLVQISDGTTVSSQTLIISR
jgi:FKBP-type peptidyl-prolyl cis-trans isomerase